jgi:hypothetical protein
MLHHYNDQFINTVQGNNSCLRRESYETRKYRMKRQMSGTVDGTCSYLSALKG